MLEAIKNRRSIRFFTDEPVSDADITEILKAGFCAPSAHNKAPWHAVVVRDQESKTALATIHRWSKIVGRAPVVIAACCDRTGLDHFWVEDGSAFMENMLIQTTALGLGATWIGCKGIPRDEGDDAETVVRKTLGLPDHFGVVALMILGHPKRVPDYREPAIPEGRVHFEKYEGPKE